MLKGENMREGGSCQILNVKKRGKYEGGRWAVKLNDCTVKLTFYAPLYQKPCLMKNSRQNVTWGGRTLSSLNQSWWKLSREFCSTLCKLQFCFQFKWQLVWWWHLWQLLLFELLKLKLNQWCSIFHNPGLILGLESLICCKRLKGEKDNCNCNCWASCWYWIEYDDN